MKSYICIDKTVLLKRINELTWLLEGDISGENELAVEARVCKKIVDSSSITAQEVFNAAREKVDFNTLDIDQQIEIEHGGDECPDKYKTLEEYIENREK
jgi:hypothetical protein